MNADGKAMIVSVLGKRLCGSFSDGTNSGRLAALIDAALAEKDEEIARLTAIIYAAEEREQRSEE